MKVVLGGTQPPAPTLSGRVGQVWTIAWPIMLTSVTSLVLSLTDTAMLGRYSTEALGDAALVFPVWVLFTAIIIPWGTATQVLVARWHGAEDSRAIERLGEIGIVFVALGGVVLAVLGILAAPAIIRMLSEHGNAEPSEGGPSASAPLMLQILLAGLPFTAVTAHVRGVFGGMGDTRIAARVTLLVGLANVPFTWILVFPADLGQIGSAAGSTIAVVAGAVYMVVCARKRLGTSLGAIDRRELAAAQPMVRQWNRIALPDAVFGVASYGADVVLVSLTTTLGAASLAAFRLMSSTVSIVWIVIFGVASAIAILVGQRLGADDEPGRRSFARAGTLVMLVLALVVAIVPVISPDRFYHLFTTDRSVVSEVVSVVGFLLVVTPIMVPAMVYAAQLRAGGDTKSIMYVSVLSTTFGTIPAALFFTRTLGLGLPGIYAALLVGWIIRAALTYARFRQGHWRLEGVGPGRS